MKMQNEMTTHRQKNQLEQTMKQTRYQAQIKQPLARVAVALFSVLIPSIAQAQPGSGVVYTHPTEQIDMGSQSRFDLDVARVEGNWVTEYNEDRQGSIVKLFNPFYQEVTDPNEVSEEPNQKIKIRVNPGNSSANLPGWTLCLQEEAPFPYTTLNTGGGAFKGMLRILDGTTVIKTEDQKSVDLTTGTGVKEFNIEGCRSGVVTLRLIVKDPYGDESPDDKDAVRISVIPGTPQSGRIMFVNPAAANASNSGNNPPAFYDDFNTNAATFVSQPLNLVNSSAQEKANIVVAAQYAGATPVSFSLTNQLIKYGCVIAGVGGNYLAGVTTTQFDLNKAPTLDAGGNGRIFEVTATGDDAAVNISGVTFVGGRASRGGALFKDENATNNISITHSAFSQNQSTGMEIFVDNFDVDDVPIGNSPQSAAAVINLTQDFGGGAVYIRINPDLYKSLTANTPGIKNGPLFNRVTWAGQTAGNSSGGAVVFKRNPETSYGINEMNGIGTGHLDWWRDTGSKVLDKTVAALNSGSQDLPTMDGDESGSRAGKAIFYNCHFDDNSAGEGGAVASTWVNTHSKTSRINYNVSERCTGGFPVVFSKCLFENNKAQGRDRNRGGALYLTGIFSSGSAIIGCEMKNNHALNSVKSMMTYDHAQGDSGDGGAIAACFMATLTIRPTASGQQTWIHDNEATDGGGGIYNTYFTVMRTKQLKLTGNKATVMSADNEGQTEGLGDGGGMGITSGAVADNIQISLTGNNAGRWGGGVYTRNSRVDFRSASVINANTADQSGGAAHARCEDDGTNGTKTLSKDGIPFSYTREFPESAVCPLILRFIDSSITDNHAERVGGIRIRRMPNPANPTLRIYDVNKKICKLDLSNCFLQYNWANANEPLLNLPVHQLYMENTDESQGNFPNMQRTRVEDDLHSAFAEYIYIYPRWNPDIVFERHEAAKYIKNCLLWGIGGGLPSYGSARDIVQNSSIGPEKPGAPTGYQAGHVSGNAVVQASHLHATANIVTPGTSNATAPPGLLAHPSP